MAEPSAENHPPPTAQGQPLAHAPDLRAAVHVGALVLAFPLTWLADRPHIDGLGIQLSISYGWVWATAILLIGSLFNILVLPRMTFGARLLRPEDKGVFWGGLMYPLGLALAFLIFDAFAVGAAWAVMAVGDASASFVGRRAGQVKLPWNAKKSWAGACAFLLAALPAACLLLWWCPSARFLTFTGAPEWPYVWTLAVFAAVSGALLESFDGPFDDNLRVTLGVCMVVQFAERFLNFSTSGMPEVRAFQPQWLLHAVALNGVLGAAVWLLKFTDLSGALVGGVIGTLTYFYTLPQGYALLVFFVLAGSLLSRLGRKTKEDRKAAEARGGLRGVSNVVSNLGVPALCALLYPATMGHPAALLAYAGALAAAFADTASSEVGALSSKQPVLVTTRKPVPHGTNGAVTTQGYIAALLACVTLAALAWLSGFWSVVHAGHEMRLCSVEPGWGVIYSAVLVVAGLLGTTVDSLLGATVEGRVSGVGKGAVNFICTLAGALAAGGVGLLLGR